jgi:uncharacterized membrane protein HdeD (DUF308 family)
MPGWAFLLAIAVVLLLVRVGWRRYRGPRWPVYAAQVVLVLVVFVPLIVDRPGDLMLRAFTTLIAAVLLAGSIRRLVISLRSAPSPVASTAGRDYRT